MALTLRLLTTVGAIRFCAPFYYKLCWQRSALNLSFKIYKLVLCIAAKLRIINNRFDRGTTPSKNTRASLMINKCFGSTSSYLKVGL